MFVVLASSDIREEVEEGEGREKGKEGGARCSEWCDCNEVSRESERALTGIGRR